MKQLLGIATETNGFDRTQVYRDHKQLFAYFHRLILFPVRFVDAFVQRSAIIHFAERKSELYYSLLLSRAAECLLIFVRELSADAMNTPETVIYSAFLVARAQRISIKCTAFELANGLGGLNVMVCD